MEQTTRKVAELDGQIDWDGLPGPLKYEYVRQVKMVIGTAALVSGEQSSPGSNKKGTLE